MVWLFTQGKRETKMNIDDVCRKLEYQLAGCHPAIQNDTDYSTSAVLVPLVKKDGKLGVLFEVRSAKLKWQPGEICFPGGRIEPWDLTFEATAVRESQEELGVPTEDIQVLGPLNYVVSHIGIILYPFAGHIRDINKLNPNADEVAETFVVPLDYLLNYEPLLANMEVSTRPLPGFPLELLPGEYPRDWKKRTSYPVLFYRYGGYVIWGLTARVLHNFIEVCRRI